MNQPTKPPWILRKFQGKTYVTDTIPDQDGKFVGNVIAAPTSCPDWEANAALIAAAPDLVHAIQIAMRDWKDDDLGRSAEFFREANAALDKAQGR